MSSPGTFFGLNIGASALLAAQVAQDVTGNNISNADTPGYTVESATFNATAPWAQPDAFDLTTTGQLGSGVAVNNISRSRDQFLDVQVRNSYTDQGTQNSLSGWLNQVQSSFNEPSTNGINESMSDFFNSFNDLQNNPEDEGVRTTVLGKAQALANEFNSVQTSLDVTSKDLSTAVGNDVTTINGYGTQIAQLNVQIRAASAQGVQPNTLMDQRDLLLDKLSQTVNISTHTNPDGTVNVAIGSSDLVVGTSSDTVSLPTLQSRGDLTGGDLLGDTQAQTALTGYQTQLDTLANTLITQVNTVHENGMGLDGATGLAFFTGTDARSIGVNQTLVNNPDEIAAAAKVAPPATTPPPGDSSNAVLLEQVATTNIAALGNNTLSQYFGVTVSNLGGTANAAQTALTSASAASQQFVNQRNSVTGVNSDQELTHMMQYQSAYQAAAKYVSTQDQMLNTLIGMVGTAPG